MIKTKELLIKLFIQEKKSKKMKYNRKISLLVIFMLTNTLLTAQMFFIEQSDNIGYNFSPRYTHGQLQGVFGVNCGIGYDIQISTGFLTNGNIDIIPIKIGVNTYYTKKNVYAIIGKFWILNEKSFMQNYTCEVGTALVRNKFIFKFGIIFIQSDEYFWGLSFNVKYKKIYKGSRANGAETGEGTLPQRDWQEN